MFDVTADLFGEPPLIKGEDKQRYCRLLAAVTHEIKPKTLFDEVLVRDMTDKLWEQQRSKQNVAALVTSTFIEALACLLRVAMPPQISMSDPALEIARDCYSGHTNSDKMEEITTYLEHLGITQEHIRAKAMQLCGGDVAMFNRMSTSCETTLRQLRKELERRPEVKNDPVASPSLVPKEVVEK
jgi:hypothetical protein